MYAFYINFELSPLRILRTAKWKPDLFAKLLSWSLDYVKHWIQGRKLRFASADFSEWHLLIFMASRARNISSKRLISMISFSKRFMLINFQVLCYRDSSNHELLMSIFQYCYGFESDEFLFWKWYYVFINSGTSNEVDFCAR